MSNADVTRPLLPARVDVPFTVIGWHYIHRPCEFLWLNPRSLRVPANGPIYLGKGPRNG
jgi:hypothetical protein